MQVNHVLRMVGLWALLFAIGSLWTSPAAAQQPPQRTCYQQQKVVIPLDDACDWSWCQDWRRNNTYGKQADGSITFRAKAGSGYGGANWRVWVDQAKATATSDQNATVQYGWTIPPQVWCSDQSAKLTVSVAASGDSVLGGIRLRTSDVNLMSEWTVDGKEDPWGDGVISGGTSGGYVAPRTAAVTTRPKPNYKEWDIWVRMSSSNGEFEVHYLYSAIPPGQEPPSQPTSAAPQPTPAAPQPTSAAPQPSTGGVPGTTLSLPPFGSPEPSPNVSRMTLQAAQRRVLANDLVLVPVWLINGDNVANINFDLTYTASVARPDGTIAKGNLLDNALLSVNPNVSGVIRAGFAQTSGISGTGTVMYVPFRAVGKVGDRTRLDLTVTTINNPSGTVLTIDRIPGEIVIVGAGDVVLGDCDGDGRLSALDAECALDISVGLRALILALDMDKSGDVTSRDAVLILQRIVSFIR